MTLKSSIKTKDEAGFIQQDWEEASTKMRKTKPNQKGISI